MSKPIFTKDEYMQATREEGRLALLNAAREARIRGDIGKEGGPEAWFWLEHWADRNYPIKPKDAA